jgi:hypothetical protein
MNYRPIDTITERVESPDFYKSMEQIKEMNIPDEMLYYIEKYEEICGDRDRFLWNWVQSLTTSRNPGFMFSTVPEEYTQHIGSLKTILTIFVATLDDIADKYKDKELLEKCLDVPFEEECIDTRNINDINKIKRIKLAEEIWDNINLELMSLPRYEEFKDIFTFDIKQLLNSLHHSYVINVNPYLINLKEAEIYANHNMTFYLYSDIDLMASPSFDFKDLPYLREVIWRAQKMARIGNWLSTWEREIKEGDFSSGIFAYAISNKILNVEDLDKKNKEEIVELLKKHDIEKHFLEKWQDNYNQINNITSNINSIDINQYLEGLEQILSYHLASKGLK